MLPKPASCQQCLGWRWGKEGFVPADGSGRNGVLIVLEAAGESEEAVGLPVVGKAGQALFQWLKRVGLDRDDFKIHNVLSCRPPNNKLAGMPYELQVIDSCRIHLDITIREMQQLCKANGKTFTILTLGKTAFKRILGLKGWEPTLKEDYYCYPFYSHDYSAWVVSAMHPSYLMRGNQHEVPVLQFAATRAVEIAKEGFSFSEPQYLLDPDAIQFGEWVETFKKAYANDPSLVLSYDIETPYKSGKNEEEVEQPAVNVEGDDYTILRCSFAYHPYSAVSVRWDASHMPLLKELFAHPVTKLGWNNRGFDDDRVAAEVPFHGNSIDAMLAWHVLNSNLPKGLGYVTPYYWQRFMWKHLSKAEPAKYNAIDALAALHNWTGIQRDLKANNLWHVFDRHVVQLGKVLAYMSEKGFKRDEDLRDSLESRLTNGLAEAQAQMEVAVPVEAKALKVYQKAPKDLTGLVQVLGRAKTTRCPACGATGVKAAHYKSIGVKRTKAGEAENPCVGRKSEKVVVDTQLWAKPLPFKLSLQSMTRYQSVYRHRPIRVKDRNTGLMKVTFDVNAIRRLVKQYPKDLLYPIIENQRYLSKLRGSYVGVRQPDGTVKGGMPTDPLTGRGRPAFNFNPETLRLACPFFHTLPRPGKPEEPHSQIRNMIVADPGEILLARDFSGIEAVLVGYEAKAPRYIRLAKQDVHSFYSAWAIHELDPKRIPANDLPQFSWDDNKLFPRLAELKKELKVERNGLYKHLVHAINFGQGPDGARKKILLETEVNYPVDLIAKVMGVYKELFPEIPVWQTSVRLQAELDGYLRNAFGYLLRFNGVFAYELVDGQWEKKLGRDAEAVLAFLPQSTAAGIIKEAMLRMFQDRFEEIGQYLRLQVHDECFFSVPEGLVDVVDEISREIMEAPIKEMPLDPSWGMGEHLVVLTESKRGYRWGQMK